MTQFKKGMLCQIKAVNNPSSISWFAGSDNPLRLVRGDLILLLGEPTTRTRHVGVYFHSQKDKLNRKKYINIRFIEPVDK